MALSIVQIVQVLPSPMIPYAKIRPENPSPSKRHPLQPFLVNSGRENKTDFKGSSIHLFLIAYFSHHVTYCEQNIAFEAFQFLEVVSCRPRYFDGRHWTFRQYLIRVIVLNSDSPLVQRVPEIPLETRLGFHPISVDTLLGLRSSEDTLIIGIDTLVIMVIRV